MIKHKDMKDVISLKPVAPEDEEFLYHVYASTRAMEMALLPDWSNTEKESFLRMQYRAQITHYRTHTPKTDYNIILHNHKKVGRLYLDHRENEIRIIDIALLAINRNMGIGSSLLIKILAQGKKDKLPVTIHVESNNPAMTLYKRLGFKRIEEHGIYYLMEKIPSKEDN